VKVHALDRREVGVQENGVDGQRLRLPLLRGRVATPALDAQLHLHGAVLVEGGQDHVRGEDLHVGVRLEVSGLDHTDSLGPQAQDLRAVHVQPEDHLAEIEHDVEGVFRHARQMGELVEDAPDLHPRGRRPVDRGEQDPAVGVSDGQGQAGLEGLDGQLAVGRLLGDPFVAGRELKLQHEDPLEDFRGVEPRPRSIAEMRVASSRM
jgi:hypothetical protein